MNGDKNPLPVLCWEKYGKKIIQVSDFDKFGLDVVGCDNSQYITADAT